jgi:hypothetical protein
VPEACEGGPRNVDPSGIGVREDSGKSVLCRQLLKSLHRGSHIVFDFRENEWRFNLTSSVGFGLLRLRVRGTP